jgi:hypothetical protein
MADGSPELGLGSGVEKEGARARLGRLGQIEGGARAGVSGPRV